MNLNPVGPPGTPPTVTSFTDVGSSERSGSAVSDLGTGHSGRSYKGGAPPNIPSAFNRTRPAVVSSKNTTLSYKSPPPVKRRNHEPQNNVFLWDLEDEDDIPQLSDSDGEGESFALSNRAVLCGEIGRKILPTQPKRISPTEGGDVFSDSEYNSRGNEAVHIQNRASSEAVGPNSPSLKYRRQDETHIPKNGTTSPEPSGDIPQSPDEHATRLKEIMQKREKRKKKKKKSRDRKDSDESGSSVVSGASSNTKTSSKYSSHSDLTELSEFILNDKKKQQKQEKKTSFLSDEGSGISRASKASSRTDEVSTISKGRKSPSKTSSQGKWNDVRTETKYTTLDDDKSSNVSGASSSASSIFASTRAKLKGYLTSYSRKNKKKGNDVKEVTIQGVESPLSPAGRGSTTGADVNQGTPSTLPSIDESEFGSIPDKMSPNFPPKLTHTLSSSHKNFEEKVLQVASPTSAKTHLPSFHNTVESDKTTHIIDLPWCHEDKSASLDGKLISGHYSGPVNKLLQPDGNGKLVLEANNSSAFHGTWEGGKLISPLTDDPELVTDDEQENDDAKDRRGRVKKGAKKLAEVNSILPKSEDEILPQGTNIRYAINQHRRISMDAAIARENAALDESKRSERRVRLKRKPLVRYNLGDACRTPHDMIICRSKQEAIESASVLKKWDGAFIKRSCGVWTYAILIERAPQPLNVLKKRLEYFYWATVCEVDPRYEMEDSMLFAIDGEGATKIIPKHAWAKYVRRIDPNPIPVKINSKRGSPYERKPSGASLFSEEDGTKNELDLKGSGKEAPVYLC
jgi:hypothetical protein